MMAGEPILIVDDTPVNLKLTRILLANQGYQVFGASSAEEAVAWLETHVPSMVLTDLHLPGMDGLTFTRLLKSAERTRDVIVVALSAFSSIGEQEEALRAGCDGCIEKPIDTRLFSRQVRDFLERRRVEAPAAPAMAAGTLADSALLPLRKRFLQESANQVRQWTSDLDSELDAESAARVVHQWIGAAGLLGYPEISEMARGLEFALHARPIDTGELRQDLDELLYAFAARMAEHQPDA